MLARCTVGRTFVTGVSPSAQAAFQKNDFLTNLREVSENLFLVIRKNLCADRHFNHQVGCARASAIFTLPVHPAFSLEMLRVAEIDQRIEPAIFDIFLAAKTDGPRAASAGFEIDLGLVEKMHGRYLCISSKKASVLEVRSNADCRATARGDKAEDLLICFIEQVFDPPKETQALC